MRDVTDLMDHYRVVARSIWNTGFWSQPDLQNWDSRDDFREIRKLLFNALVIARLDAERDLQVVPVGSTAVPIMIQRPREGDQAHNRYWDDPQK